LTQADDVVSSALQSNPIPKGINMPVQPKPQAKQQTQAPRNISTRLLDLDVTVRNWAESDADIIASIRSGNTLHTDGAACGRFCNSALFY
jgi:hypothetical protein